jgi:hypothetical protein
MRHLDPCCSNLTSSKAQISIRLFLRNFGSFFIFRLLGGISVRNFWPRFAESKAELSEKALTLSNSKGDAPLILNETRKGFSIPKALQSEFGRIFSHGRFNRGELLFGKSAGTPGPLSIDQACNTLVFKPVDPVRNRPGCIAQDLSNLPATLSLGDEKHGVEAMIVAGFLGTANFVLDSHNHVFGIGDCECFHESTTPRF